jgi:hypothetical protein
VIIRRCASQATRSEHAGPKIPWSDFDPIGEAGGVFVGWALSFSRGSVLGPAGAAYLFPVISSVGEPLTEGRHLHHASNSRRVIHPVGVPTRPLSPSAPMPRFANPGQVSAFDFIVSRHLRLLKAPRSTPARCRLFGSRGCAGDGAAGLVPRERSRNVHGVLALEALGLFSLCRMDVLLSICA